MSTDALIERQSSVRVWGLPLAPLTLAGTLDAVDRLIAAGEASYFITANVNYAMLTARDARLAAVNEEAAFVLADGMPLVWASHWKGGRLPERVAGSDLVPALCGRAAERGHRVFFLGGAPGVADAAAERLRQRYPGLQVAGVESPPFRPLTAPEEAALVARIRATRPDLLFAALGQPRGELWLSQQREALAVPVCVQVGASLDFAAGRVARAPRWVQRLGIEWIYRAALEPRRLAGRYARNVAFLAGRLTGDLASLLCRGSCREARPTAAALAESASALAAAS